jgi:hypothetical protein
VQQEQTRSDSGFAFEHDKNTFPHSIRHPLNFIEFDSIIPAIVEASGTDGFVPGEAFCAQSPH